MKPNHSTRSAHPPTSSSSFSSSSLLSSAFIVPRSTRRNSNSFSPIHEKQKEKENVNVNRNGKTKGKSNEMDMDIDDENENHENENDHHDHHTSSSSLSSSSSSSLSSPTHSPRRSLKSSSSSSSSSSPSSPSLSLSLPTLPPSLLLSLPPLLFQCQQSLLSLSSHLLCAICLSLVTSPLSLPCSHFFCKDCVMSLHSSAVSSVKEGERGKGREAKFKCPKCREETTRRMVMEDKNIINLVNYYREFEYLLPQEEEDEENDKYKLDNETIEKLTEDHKKKEKELEKIRLRELRDKRIENTKLSDRERRRRRKSFSHFNDAEKEKVNGKIGTMNNNNESDNDNEDEDDEDDEDGDYPEESSRGRRKRVKSNINDDEPPSPSSLPPLLRHTPANRKPRPLTLPPLPRPIDDKEYCSVCGDSSPFVDDEILLCDGAGCTVSVHQSCYGVTKVPEGEWLCSLCEHHIPSTTIIHCVICDNLTDRAMKPTDDGQWIHAGCSFWHSEIHYGNAETRHPVIGWDKVNPARYKLRCDFCNERGACIQCTYKKCLAAFHVSCAAIYGCKFELVPIKKRELRGMTGGEEEKEGEEENDISTKSKKPTRGGVRRGTLTTRKRPPPNKKSPPSDDDDDDVHKCIWCPKHKILSTEELRQDLISNFVGRKGSGKGKGAGSSPKKGGEEKEKEMEDEDEEGNMKMDQDNDNDDDDEMQISLHKNNKKSKNIPKKKTNKLSAMDTDSDLSLTPSPSNNNEDNYHDDDHEMEEFTPASSVHMESGEDEGVILPSTTTRITRGRSVTPSTSLPPSPPSFTSSLLHTIPSHHIKENIHKKERGKLNGFPSHSNANSNGHPSSSSLSLSSDSDDNDPSSTRANGKLVQSTLRLTRSSSTTPPANLSQSSSSSSVISSSPPKFLSRLSATPPPPSSKGNISSSSSSPSSPSLIHFTHSNITNEEDLRILAKFFLLFPHYRLTPNNDITPLTTYLLSPATYSNNFIVEVRSKKYFQCILSHRPIISIDWIHECVRRKCILSIDKYYVLGDTVAMGGVQRSCISSSHLSLFKGKSFVLYNGKGQSWGKEGMLWDKCKILVEEGGGNVIELEDLGKKNASHIHFIVNDSPADREGNKEHFLHSKEKEVGNIRKYIKNFDFHSASFTSSIPSSSSPSSSSPYLLLFPLLHFYFCISKFEFSYPNEKTWSPLKKKYLNINVGGNEYGIANGKGKGMNRRLYEENEKEREKQTEDDVDGENEEMEDIDDGDN